MPKQPTWVLIAFIATLVFGFLLFARVYSNCGAAAPGWTPCALYDVAKDFKEVFGWAIAMYVAYIAARPVWEQLKLMRVDVDISSIKFLEKEIEALKRLRFDVERALDPLIGYIQSHARIDEDFAWEGNEHAAREAEYRAGRVKDSIKGNGSFERGVEGARQVLIDAISQLQACFYELNLVDDIKGEPEISEAQVTAAYETERVAATEIDGRIGDLYGARTLFDGAITKAITDRTELISEKRTEMVKPR